MESMQVEDSSDVHFKVEESLHSRVVSIVLQNVPSMHSLAYRYLQLYVVISKHCEELQEKVNS